MEKNLEIRKPGELISKNPLKLVNPADKPKKEKKAPRKLIFLSGFKNTGKDTVAKMIKEISIEPVVITSFADALKAELYPQLGREWTGVDDEDREWKDSIRDKMISYGEGQKMKFDQNYWVKRALDEILLASYERKVDIPHIIVTDARRVEELMWFKHFKLGHFAELEDARKIYDPIMFVVHREGAQSDEDYLTHVALEYATETRMFQRLIKNYGTEKELKNLLNDIYIRDIR